MSKDPRDKNTKPNADIIENTGYFHEEDAETNNQLGQGTFVDQDISDLIPATPSTIMAAKQDRTDNQSQLNFTNVANTVTQMRVSHQKTITAITGLGDNSKDEEISVIQNNFFSNHKMFAEEEQKVERTDKNTKVTLVDELQFEDPQVYDSVINKKSRFKDMA